MSLSIPLPVCAPCPAVATGPTIETIWFIICAAGVQHPVARVDGVELDVRACATPTNTVLLGNQADSGTPAFSAGDVELRAVDVHRVMIHAEVDHAYRTRSPSLTIIGVVAARPCR